MNRNGKNLIHQLKQQKTVRNKGGTLRKSSDPESHPKVGFESVSGFGFRVSGFGFRSVHGEGKSSESVSGFGFRVSGFGFRRLKPTFAVGFGFRVSGFGFRVSGFVD